MSKRPEHPCTWCGRTTTSRVRICQSCATCTTQPLTPTYEHALTGGRWIRHRGIQIWRPATHTTQEGRAA